MLKAAFWLLAIVIITELMMTMVVGAGCFWLIMTNQYKIGACENISAQVREIWAEVLAAILALLLASKSNGGPPPPDSEGPPESKGGE